MFTEQTEISAADARARLCALRCERLEAAEIGLAGNARYMSDLDADIAESETTYVTLAVSEIASLRADVGDELRG